MRLYLYLQECNSHKYYSIEFDLDSKNDYSSNRSKLLDFIAETNNKVLNKNYSHDKYRFLDSEYLLISNLSCDKLKEKLNSLLGLKENIVVRKLSDTDIQENDILRRLIQDLNLEA